MALKGQSIRNGVTIYVNGTKAEKQLVIELSESWEASQEKFFKKKSLTLLQKKPQIIFNFKL